MVWKLWCWVCVVHCVDTFSKIHLKCLAHFHPSLVSTGHQELSFCSALFPSRHWKPVRRQENSQPCAVWCAVHPALAKQREKLQVWSTQSSEAESLDSTYFKSRSPPFGVSSPAHLLRSVSLRTWFGVVLQSRCCLSQAPAAPDSHSTVICHKVGKQTDL